MNIDKRVETREVWEVDGPLDAKEFYRLLSEVSLRCDTDTYDDAFVVEGGFTIAFRPKKNLP